MQPQGLAALMQQGQMNNPRLAAATDIVSSDAEKNILDPRTLALIKYKDAVQAMQAADQMMAAAQPQPMPPTVAERTRLAAEQGIAGLASRLAPGVQQRGAQMAAQQGAGGLPQLAAPNMARMAGGGIVAFQEGGGPVQEEEEIPAEVRYMYAGSGLSDAQIREAMRSAEPINRYIEENPMDAALLGLTATGIGAPLAGATGATISAGSKALPWLYRVGKGLLSTGKGRAIAGAGGFGISNLMDMNGEEPVSALPRGLGITSIMPGGVEKVAERPQQETAPAAQPSNLNVGIAAPAPAPATPIGDRLRSMADRGETSVQDAGKRYRELTGMEDAIEQRRVEQERLRALQESRFSPEKERSRLLRAALASGAQRGLGGFGMGYTAEEERIAGERQQLQQQVVADMDKTISELRALGVGQFEAEQAAQEIHSNEIRALAQMEQEMALAQMDVDQRMAIAEMEAALTREGRTQEQSAALTKAINEYAMRMRMTSKDIFTLAVDLMQSALPGQMTFDQALQQVIDNVGSSSSSVITNIRPAD